ncbi:MAG TPA: ATP-binding protein [Dissulfurispiraceae bacterium]
METLIIIVLTLAVLFLAFYMNRVLRSVEDISSFMKEIASGNFNARLFTGGRGRLDEVAREMVATMESTKAKLDFAEAERQRMDAMLRGMSGGVLITDTQGRVVLANRAFRKLLSVHEDIEGKQIMEVLRNTQLIEMFRNAMDSWEIISEELSVSRGQRELYFSATAVPVYSRDSVSGIILTLHDITRLKHLEEMRKDFVANVSHEIKTPITAIKGFTETLLDGAIDDRDNAVRFLSVIKNHSERLNSLVDDLMTLSRVELGDIRISRTEVDLEQVIDSVFMTLTGKAEKKGLYLKKSVPGGIQTVMADRDRLVQIMLNLVDNGIKFTEKGGITAGIDETGGKLALYVQDTGIGVPPNHLHRLGERFYRVDRARSRDLGGTGLGLAIVKHLVQAHDWSMRIESEHGKGTRVAIIVDKYL